MNDKIDTASLIKIDTSNVVYEAVVKPIQFRSYEDIWEKNGRWLIGPSLLTDIILWLKGKSLFVIPDHESGTANISLPLPSVVNEISAELVNVYHMIPEELQPIFIERCNLVLDARREQIGERLSNFLFKNAIMNDLTKHEIETILRNLENEMRYHRQPELWQLAAQAFGFDPYRLPKRAGIVIQN